MKFKKRLIVSVTILTLGLLTGIILYNRNSNTAKSYKDTGVSIEKRDNYYKVTLDYSTGITPEAMGANFASGILKVIPTYEQLIDSYLAESIGDFEYPYVLSRVNDIKATLNTEYYDEIKGMASVISEGTDSIRNDGKLSEAEVFLYNLFPDVARSTKCSFVSVYSNRSETNSTISGRNLDWYEGSDNQLPKLHCITTIQYPDKKISLIGFLGFMGAITTINDSNMMSCILDSQTGLKYSSLGKRSYVFDLRYAMEQSNTIHDASNYMMDPDKNYAFSHIIAFSDSQTSFLLENNMNGTEKDSLRAIRTSDSKLHSGITWNISNGVGSVNSYLLQGNFDNHNTTKNNVLRWNNMKRELEALGDTVSFEEMKTLITYKESSIPAPFLEGGDLYNANTLQTIVFQPATGKLNICFRPANKKTNPTIPVFESVSLFMNEE